jgi:hypothetical protein
MQRLETGRLRHRRRARDLIGRGVEVSELFHLDGGPVPGPDPQRRSYQTYATFSDPDGNGWLSRDQGAASGP